MISNPHYENDELALLFRHQGHENNAELLSHVESCQACQEKLETMSRGELTWDEVTELLVPAEGLAGLGSTAQQVSSQKPIQKTACDDDELRSSSNSDASFLEPSDNPEALGRFDRFEIMELLGRGGMGIVMRGYDTSLSRQSAVKVLSPELASNAAARRRFSREARSAAAVVHPHVIPIQTVDEHAGIPYLVMPVVEGKSVDDRVRKSGPLRIVEAVRIASQVADGLAAAHEQGLVHRDIKPANILLENGVERVQITDFGLARAVDDASMTRSGLISGTPQYMSPEQAHGDAIDHRSDLFSLGSLIYFMVTGRSPFRAETTMGVLNRIGNDQPRPMRSINPDVPEWLDQIVAKLIEKEPDQRFQTASEVAVLLNRWLAHLQQPELIPAPKLPGKDAGRATSSVKFWLGSLSLVVMLATFLFIWNPGGGARQSANYGNNSLNSKSKVTPNNQKPDDKEKVQEAFKLKGLGAGQKELWRAPLGTFAMRAPVIHKDQIFVTSNNGHGYLKRYPKSLDMGVLLCFNKSDGEFLWQHSNPKLPTGRVHDWPQFGVTSRPCVEGDRLWYVTNRAEIVCLDTQGFRDRENDGPYKEEKHNGFTDADVVWRLDMMKELGVRPHNVSTCTIALWRDRIFAVTGNGVGQTHRPPLADAPSFIAVDKTSGRLLWQDNSPSQNVLHGQWGSPTVIDLGSPSKSQVVFPGGDGWLYSFDPRGTMDGKSKLIWKFDCNPKDSVWKLGGLGTRNNLIHGPTLHDGLLYCALGQDPEHGAGPGGLVCLQYDGEGDVSPQLVFNKKDPDSPIAHKREQACVESEGDFTKSNPNSKQVWRFEQQDVNSDGEIGITEKLHRSLSTIAFKDDLLFLSDTEGILRCLDRRTGKQHWGFDTLTNVYSTPVVVGDRVYLGTTDGDLLVFGCSADFQKAAPKGDPIQRIECPTSVNGSVVADGEVLYIVTEKDLIAVENK